MKAENVNTLKAPVYTTEPDHRIRKSQVSSETESSPDATVGSTAREAFEPVSEALKAVTKVSYTVGVSGFHWPERFRMEQGRGVHLLEAGLFRQQCERRCKKNVKIVRQFFIALRSPS
ncbi:MAG: hypothetical protein WCA21_17395 [Terracidiphilus sp.]